MPRTDNPPSFQPHPISFVSVKDSKITNISLYSSRAEVTRVFKLNAQAGLNRVNITGLPNALDRDSMRAEGTGRATIHDVTISQVPLDAKPTSSAQLEELVRNKGKKEQAIARCTLAIKSLETYLGTLNAKDVSVSQVANIVNAYQTTGEELDNQLTVLRDQLAKLDESISVEQKNLSEPRENQDLRMKAAIEIFAGVRGEVEIKLTYAVHGASWNALYDMRVDMHAQEKPVEFTYKASITQGTGEDWADVNLTLETAEPTFGIRVPYLPPWTVSICRPLSVKTKTQHLPARSSNSPAVPADEFSIKRRCHVTPFDDTDGVQHQEAHVSSKGNITAAFCIPGKISIPSDGATHNVTIAQMNLDAKMRWITVPKQEVKAHLIAKIKNASEYTFLPGQANIYLDGSFIARTQIPPVSPEESFDCPLGLDPSIRVAYHPRNKKTTCSGFYNKTMTHTYTQRITIFNTKTTEVDDLRVTDQFPVSDDSTIRVKHTRPALVDVLNESSPGEIQIPEKVRISPGVFAQWNGADEPDVNVEWLGKDGKFDWICSVPPQGEVDLFLHYDVTVPPRAQIIGL